MGFPLENIEFTRFFEIVRTLRNSWIKLETKLVSLRTLEYSGFLTTPYLRCVLNTFEFFHHPPVVGRGDDTPSSGVFRPIDIRMVTAQRISWRLVCISPTSPVKINDHVATSRVKNIGRANISMNVQVR